MNDPRKLFVDERLTGMCVYCGAEPDTRDHCPSRVFLDEPYPANLAVVEACAKCNGSFSLDEQYFACFVECVMCGTTDPRALKREKIARVLTERPQLAADIQSTLTMDASGGKIWQPDMERVKKVVIKLARGHLHYELGLLEQEIPAMFDVVPLDACDSESLEFFERPEPGRARCGLSWAHGPSCAPLVWNTPASTDGRSFRRVATDTSPAKGMDTMPI